MILGQDVGDVGAGQGPYRVQVWAGAAPGFHVGTGDVARHLLSIDRQYVHPGYSLAVGKALAYRGYRGRDTPGSGWDEEVAGGY